MLQGLLDDAACVQAVVPVEHKGWTGCCEGERKGGGDVQVGTPLGTILEAGASAKHTIKGRARPNLDLTCL